jgi:2-keto-4-pentenoate hydratase/2-oxohepta-3-ene-1,7-dioic acid hydratase in catechol pathway
MSTGYRASATLPLRVELIRQLRRRRTLIAFLSGSTTLLPGTVILTGTPEGVGMAKEPPLWLKPGDVYEVEIEGIGTLANPVVLEPV